MQLSDSSSLIHQEGLQLLIVDNQHAHSTISLHGGHVISFMPKHDHRPRLWLSEKAILDAKHPIRGGIPVCWPWFGAHSADTNYPSHGYVRNQPWHIIDCQDRQTETVVHLQPQNASGEGFTGQAQLTLVVKVGRELSVQLITHNIGQLDFTYNGALHSYFKVDDITRCELQGLEGDYQDKLQNYALAHTPHPYRFNTETDRVHLATPHELCIAQDAGNTDILSSGHDSIVVWNPWAANAKAMADMTDEGYKKMLCVETAVTRGRIVTPGQSHTLEQIIR
ncbi:MAG: glucose-6-phosphate 1-epimerase [Paraglaciecola sp.]|jgi:glucose-6-phosphate 1-epimerase